MFLKDQDKDAPAIGKAAETTLTTLNIADIDKVSGGLEKPLYWRPGCIFNPP